MSISTYSPGEISCIVGTQIMDNWETITVARDEQAFTKNVSTDGRVTRTKNLNRTGTLTISFYRSSLSLDYISTLANLDNYANAGVVPVYINDPAGTTQIFAAEGWVQKIPDASTEKELPTVDVVIDLGQIDMFVGGNNRS